MSADHTGFIVAAYAVTGTILLITVLVLVIDARVQRMLLKRYGQPPGDSR